MGGVTCDDMSGEVHIKLLSREDTSGEVRMFRAHVERCHVRGGTGAGGSHVLDYGRVGP
ncbi:hypothetical protein DEO72_LG5g2061 [Vigna unguiculata]|uniref:Uncharacterized protein n=1 Tax=Vigna unguiculata TaxID=3917 RepID=A0A4D6LZR4_VIGUN|nr:hypothetical protein DEO72_LG5g2061 [Vigna unguiculata]